MGTVWAADAWAADAWAADTWADSEEPPVVTYVHSRVRRMRQRRYRSILMLLGF